MIKIKIKARELVGTLAKEDKLESISKQFKVEGIWNVPN